MLGQWSFNYRTAAMVQPSGEDNHSVRRTFLRVSRPVSINILLKYLTNICLSNLNPKVPVLNKQVSFQFNKLNSVKMVNKAGTSWVHVRTSALHSIGLQVQKQNQCMHCTSKWKSRNSLNESIFVGKMIISQVKQGSFQSRFLFNQNISIWMQALFQVSVQVSFAGPLKCDWFRFDSSPKFLEFLHHGRSARKKTKSWSSNGNTRGDSAPSKLG